MRLETLEGIEEINGFKILNMDLLSREPKDLFNESGDPNYFVYAWHKEHSLTFVMQSGPIKEVGVNGCQVDTLIHAAKIIIEGLNKKFPCRENSLVITRLEEALFWLDKRKQDRE